MPTIEELVALVKSAPPGTPFRMSEEDALRVQQHLNMEREQRKAEEVRELERRRARNQRRNDRKRTAKAHAAAHGQRKAAAAVQVAQQTQAAVSANPHANIGREQLRQLTEKGWRNLLHIFHDPAQPPPPEGTPDRAAFDILAKLHADEVSEDDILFDVDGLDVPVANATFVRVAPPEHLPGGAMPLVFWVMLPPPIETPIGVPVQASSTLTSLVRAVADEIEAARAIANGGMGVINRTGGALLDHAAGQGIAQAPGETYDEVRARAVREIGAAIADKGPLIIPGTPSTITADDLIPDTVGLAAAGTDDFERGLSELQRTDPILAAAIEQQTRRKS